MGRKKKLTSEERLNKAFDTVMAFPEGVEALRHILFLTGYNEPLLLQNPHTFEVNHMGSLVNLAKRDVWFEIRKHLTPEHSLRLERVDVAQDVEPEQPEEKSDDDRE